MSSSNAQLVVKDSRFVLKCKIKSKLVTLFHNLLICMTQFDKKLQRKNQQKYCSTHSKITNYCRANITMLSNDDNFLDQDDMMNNYSLFQICSMQRNTKWTIQRDPNLLAPFACKDNLFIGYDDRDSFALKSRYARVHGLAGIGIWSIENDDFTGKCFSEVKFPLIKSAVNELRGTNTSIPVSKLPPTTSGSTNKPDNGLWSSTTDRPWSWTYSTAPTMHHQHTSSTPSTWWPQPSSTSSPSTWWPQPSSSLSTAWTSSTSNPYATSSTTTTSPSVGKPSGAVCKYPGTFIHPTDCRKFYRCVRISIEEKYKMYEYTCPPNTLFDVNSRNCLWDYLVNDCRDGKNRK